MKIRLAAVEDADMLGRLRFAMRRERETSPAPADMEAFLQANIDYFARFIADKSYIGAIAEESGSVIAVGGICLHNHPPSYGVPNGKSACLLNMYTLPEHRGKGAASEIVAFLVEEARKHDCCKVYLNASVMGKGVYKRFGFEDVENEMVFDCRKPSLQ